MADYLSYILLGIIQGLAEVFPVSSSAHLALTNALLQDFQGFQVVSLEAVIIFHLGTVIAILYFYQRDILTLWRASGEFMLHRLTHRPTSPSANNPEVPTAFGMLFSLALTGGVGLALRPTAYFLFDQPVWVAALLVINGVVLWASSRLIPQHKPMSRLSWGDYALIGIVQGVAVLPGISRFGMTLCVGLWRGLSWYEALKFSFLLSLPTILAANGLAALEIYGQGWPTHLNVGGVALGTLIATVACFLAIQWLLRLGLHGRKHLGDFGIYCLIVGAYAMLFFAYLG